MHVKTPCKPKVTLDERCVALDHKQIMKYLYFGLLGVLCLAMFSCSKAGPTNADVALANFSGTWIWWENRAGKAERYLSIAPIPDKANNVLVIITDLDHPQFSRRGLATLEDRVLKAHFQPVAQTTPVSKVPVPDESQRDLTLPVDQDGNQQVPDDPRNHGDQEISPFLAKGNYEFDLEQTGELRMVDAGQVGFEGGSWTWYRPVAADIAE